MSKLSEITAFNMKTRQQTAINNPEIVTHNNGTKALKGIAADDGVTKVHKFLSKAVAAELEKELAK